jgi:hypothetical protein
MNLFWLILGLLICYGSYRLDVGSPASPGPGFIPLLSGILMVGSSLSVLLLSGLGGPRGPQAEKTGPGARLYREVSLLLVSLIGFMLLMSYLGFALCTLFFMGFLLKVVGSQRWKTVVIGALSTSAGASILFQWVLKCQFPTGIIGF